MRKCRPGEKHSTSFLFNLRVLFLALVKDKNNSKFWGKKEDI